MKDNGAVLLRRVLHEGLFASMPEGLRRLDTPQYAATLARMICIVDTTPVEDVPLKNPTDIGEIAIPFRNFWLEGQIDVEDEGSVSGYRWGAVCRQEGDILQVVFVLTVPGKPCHGVSQVNFQVVGNRIVSVKLIEDGSEEEMEYDGGVQTWLQARFAYLLSVLGCKNISLQDVPHDPAAQKRLTKIRGCGRHTYKVLAVQLLKRARTSGTGEGLTGVMPLHRVIGHFAEYGPAYGKGLLFGKYAGRFFIPEYEKGDEKNGVVHKDYIIPQSSSVQASPSDCHADEQALSAQSS